MTDNMAAIEIRRAVAQARALSPYIPESAAADYIRDGWSPEAVRADLFERVCAPISLSV